MGGAGTSGVAGGGIGAGVGVGMGAELGGALLGTAAVPARAWLFGADGAVVEQAAKPSVRLARPVNAQIVR
jgi:hypothetical protein